MKNSDQKEPKPKVNYFDIVDGIEMREQKTFEVNGTRYWADRITKDQIATHSNCEDCNIEFEKDYTYQRKCFPCKAKSDRENFNKLEVVNWDGTTPLCIWGDDQYFFDGDSIDCYCEENEIPKDQLQLVLCTQTSFGEINIAEQFQDELHEDWEADGKLAELESALNDYLKKASTNTWVETNKRVQLI